MELIEHVAVTMEPERRIDIVKRDPADNRVLEATAAADVDFVVSGDSHLLELEQPEDIPIVTARELLRRQDE